jgi:hypothetical protein
MWMPQAEENVRIVSWSQVAKAESSLSMIIFLLTILPFAHHGIVVRKTDCISCERNGATVGSKDYDISSHSGVVAEGHQLCRVNVCVSPRVGSSNEERAEKERREGHLEVCNRDIVAI